jgi:predicted DsbA family dithiol-disulfide isomerase
MHERLFANQRALEPFTPHAEALGLDVAKFEECMSSDKYADLVREDMNVARSAGATGTPSFVVALTDPDDPTKVEGISFIRGAQPFNAFKTQIDQALAQAQKGEDGDGEGEESR